MSCSKALAALLLLAACAERGAPPAPVLYAVTPATTFDTEATSLEIEGEHFYARGVLRLGSGASGDDHFRLLVGEVPLESVTRTGSTRLAGLLPAGLPAGVYPLRLEDPWGREATLEAAVTIRKREGAVLRAEVFAPAAVQEGNSVVVNVAVSNEGDTAALDVRVAPAAPSGTGGAVLLGQTGPQTLQPGEARTWSLRYRTTGAGTVAFQITASGEDAFFHDQRSVGPLDVALEIFSPPVLTASATMDHTLLGVGEVLTLSTLVTNTGTMGVTAFLPSAAPQGDAGFTALSVPVAIDLAPGATRSFEFRFSVDGPGVSRFFVDGQGTALSLPAFLRPVTTGTVQVLTPPALSATASVAPLLLAPGEVITLDLSVRNDGEEDAEQVVLQLTPTGSAAVSALSTLGNQSFPAGSTSDLRVTFAAGQVGFVSFQLSAVGLSRLGRQLVLLPTVTSDVVEVRAADADGGSDDAGLDAGPTDAGATDAGPTDAGATDAGATDAGATDAGAADAGLADAGQLDAGPVDAGLIDAGALLCDPARAGLRACYRFEGNLTDGSSFGNHATAASGTFDAGVLGRGWFNGAQGLQVRDHASLDCTDELTLEAWVRISAFPTAGNRFGIIDNDGQYGFFIHPGGDLRCTAGGVALASAAITLGAWQHVACTRDASTVRVYRNGVELGSSDAGPPLGTGTTFGLTIGQNSPSGDVLAGGLDGVRVWCETLPSLELCSTPGSCR